MMVFGLIGFVSGCAPQIAQPPEVGVELVDFSLVDQNATSASFDQSVSFLDQRGSISAWYFGHSS